MALTKSPASVEEADIQVIRVLRDENAAGQLDGEIAYRGRSAMWDIPAATKTNVIVPQIASAKAAVTAEIGDRGITGTVETSDLHSIVLPVREVLDANGDQQSPRVFAIGALQEDGSVKAFVEYLYTNEFGNEAKLSASWTLTSQQQSDMATLISQAKAALNA